MQGMGVHETAYVRRTIRVVERVRVQLNRAGGDAGGGPDFDGHRAAVVPPGVPLVFADELGSQMADILRLTRYDAIRLNKQVNCQVQQTYGGDPTLTLVWADSNQNGVQDTGER